MEMWSGVPCRHFWKLPAGLEEVDWPVVRLGGTEQSQADAGLQAGGEVRHGIAGDSLLAIPQQAGVQGLGG